MRRYGFLGILNWASMGLLTALLSGCLQVGEYPSSAGAVDDQFKADLAALNGKRIYFGHQSVGKNIMEGLADLLKESGDTSFGLADLDKAQTLSGGGIAHARLGENTNPKGKCDAFAKHLVSMAADTTAVARAYDVAVLKFCYVDVQAMTDLGDLMAHYKSSLQKVRDANSGLIIMHVTTPLKTGVLGRLEALKRKLGMGDANDKDNEMRSQFGEMLKATFPGEPFLDLAAVESTYPGGERETFKNGGKVSYRMIEGLSSDGGHLNALGKRVAAKAFVHSLASAVDKR